MPLNVRSTADLARAIAANLHRIRAVGADAVVGIPRSGLLPATLIATYLQAPLTDVEGLREGRVYRRYHRRASPPRHILLVDDAVNKGRAMTWALGEVRKFAPGIQVTTCAVYGPYQAPDAPCDLPLDDLPGPRAFEWNLWKHKRLPRWAFDMDGVLCRDPVNAENDDGPRYMDFIATAEPMFLPTRPIGHIVTSRLERYRAPTEEWLARHGVRYESLTMMPYETKAERMAAGNRGGWKAREFIRLGAEFFIESNAGQARAIAKASGKPVWCTGTASLAPA